MGVYKAAVVTENGQHLIAQAFTSEKKLIFTSAKTSSYSYPAGTNISALTGLQDVVQSVIPSGTKTIGGNVAQVTVRFDNDSIDQAYLIQTIGLYAKIEDGEETLFSVTQATVPDEMPVHSEVSPSAYIYNIQSTVQNASQITITVNPTGAASVQDFLDIQNPAFDDSGTSEEISSFPEFLDTVKSKMNFFQFFRNLKAGLQFVLHVGSIVNNCVTDNPNLPLSAAQGKALQDQLATLNSNLTVLNAKEIQFKPTVKPVFMSTNDLASGAEVMFTVTFDKAFSAIPVVTFTLRTNGDNFLSQVNNISTTGFTGYIRNPFSSAKPVNNISLCYIAMC